VDRYEPSLDDELDVLTLLKPGLSESRPTLPAYDRAIDIATEVMDLAGGIPALDDLQTARYVLCLC